MTTYPSRDPHKVWMWNNTYPPAFGDNGADPFFSQYDIDDGDPATNTSTYVIEDTNLYVRAPQSGDIIDISSYTALAYLHPWRA